MYQSDEYNFVIYDLVERKIRIGYHSQFKKNAVSVIVKHSHQPAIESILKGAKKYITVELTKNILLPTLH